MTHGTTRAPTPRGLQRLFMRMPIWIYRMQLGGLLSDHFLLLTHVGRKSGQLRQTVLEVLRHDHDSGAYIIASGWGERSDWFRNIQQRPHVLVQCGARRWEARSERLAPGAAANELADYAQRHPRALRTLARAMLGEEIAPGAEGCRKLAEHVPLVALRPYSAQAE